LFLIFRK